MGGLETPPSVMKWFVYTYFRYLLHFLIIIFDHAKSEKPIQTS